MLRSGRVIAVVPDSAVKRNEAPVAALEVTEEPKSLRHAMLKPHAPMPEHFGTTAAEVASTPNYSNQTQDPPPQMTINGWRPGPRSAEAWERPFNWCWPVLLAACELWAASKLSLNDWAQHWLSYLLTGFFGTLILAPLIEIPAAVLCWASCFALHYVLLRTWPQYQRVAQFHAALYPPRPSSDVCSGTLSLATGTGRSSPANTVTNQLTRRLLSSATGARIRQHPSARTSLQFSS